MTTTDDGPDLTEGADSDPEVRDVERKLRAWELKTQRWPLARIAEELGISKTSAWRWVEEGRKLAAQLDYLDKTRGREEGVAVMQAVQEWMFDLRKELDPAEQIKAAEVVIKAERNAWELLDLLAARRIDATIRGGNDDGPITVNGNVVRAIEQYERGGDPRDDDHRPNGEGGDGKW